VVIGKFYPPHRGHSYLIDVASAGVEQLTVIVCAAADQSIPGTLRAAWLQELHPDARIMLVDDVYPPDDSALWARLTVGWLGGAPDVVFTSEDYGERYARLMGADHVLVDRARVHVPCSGTQVRADPLLWWEYLAPECAPTTASGSASWAPSRAAPLRWRAPWPSTIRPRGRLSMAVSTA